MAVLRGFAWLRGGWVQQICSMGQHPRPGHSAQDRGEVAKSGQYSRSEEEHLPSASDNALSGSEKAGFTDLGVTGKAIHDAAQDRGEVRTVGNVPQQNNIPTAADIGLSRKEIHEARKVRDAEAADHTANAPPNVR